MKTLKYLALIFLFPSASVFCSDMEEIYVGGSKVPADHYYWMSANGYSPEAMAIMYKPSSPTINGEAYIAQKRARQCRELAGKIEGAFYACRNETFSQSVAAQNVCNGLNFVAWGVSSTVSRLIFGVSVTFSETTDYYTMCTDTLERQENLHLNKCAQKRQTSINEDKLACRGTSSTWN